MGAIASGVVTFGILLAFLGLGVPVAYALGMTVVVMMVVFGDAGQALHIAASMFEGLDSIELAAVPMFVFMGSIISASPAGADIYRALHRLLPVPGGLGISTVGGCALFAALSGSSPATAAAIGSSGVPEMLARGYPPRLATGAIVGGGTLGILIPPSIVLLIYGIVTEVSIGRLFLAGVVPGLVVTLMFGVYIYLAMVRHEARTAPPPPDAEARGSFLRVAPFLVVVLLILAALYGGWATPSEIAAVGAVLSMILVGVIYRVTRPGAWLDILFKTSREVSMIMLIAAFSYYLGQYLAFQGTLPVITEGLLDISDNRWITLLFLSLVMLFLGCFLPPFAIVVIVAPLFLPFIKQAGFDPIWFGVLVTLNMEMGLITPPIGINLFVVKAIAPQVPMRDIVLGSLPFLFMLVLASLLLCVAPGLALYLPAAVMGAP
jgi:tripartite ATP-independent transporter DctM subunit